VVDRRFHALVLRLVQYRIFQAAAVPGHRLVLECYHPSAQFSTPSLQCRYMGTAGLGRPLLAAPSDFVRDALETPGLGQLRALYTRFRLSPQDESRRGRRRYPPRPGSPRQAEQISPVTPPEFEVVSHVLHLDEDELFSQLCTATHLLRLGSSPGQVLGSVTVNDGVIRVWRDWLAARAASPRAEAEAEADGDAAILWPDPTRHVGLRCRVVETATSSRPVLVRSDEDTPVSYTLEYEGEPAPLGF